MTHTYVGDYSNSNYKKKVCLKRTALAVECKRSKIWPITLKSIDKFVFFFVLWRLSSCGSVCKHPFRIFSPPCNLTYQDEAQKQYWPHNPLTRKNGIINCCVKGCKTVKKNHTNTEQTTWSHRTQSQSILMHLFSQIMASDSVLTDKMQASPSSAWALIKTQHVVMEASVLPLHLGAHSSL